VKRKILLVIYFFFFFVFVQLINPTAPVEAVLIKNFKAENLEIKPKISFSLLGEGELSGFFYSCDPTRPDCSPNRYKLIIDAKEPNKCDPKIIGDVRLFESPACTIDDTVKNIILIKKVVFESDVTYLRILHNGSEINTECISLDPNRCVEVAAPDKDLKVSVDPAGPFDNDKINPITIIWEGEENTKYILYRGADIIEEVTCHKNPANHPNKCYLNTIIPLGSSTGTNIPIKVYKSSDYSVFGIANITINPKIGIIGSGMIPPSTPTPPIPTAPCAVYEVKTVQVLVDKKNNKFENKEFRACTEVDTGIGTLSVDPSKFVSQLFTLIFGIVGGIAFLLFIYSGYILMTSAGNKEKVQGARDTITSAIAGLLFIIFSIALLEIVGVHILRIPGWG